MSRADAYVREIQSLKAEIKRLNAHVKRLRDQKKEKEGHLYKYMVKNNLEKHNGITIKSIRPKEKIQRKTPTQKKEDAIKLFRNIGIPRPENFWLEFQDTQ